jgi:hypothetical protein
MRYKTHTLHKEEASHYEEIHSERENRLLIERIQQRNWEESGRDWKKYLSQIDWGELKPKPQPQTKVEKQTANKFW